MFKQNVPFQKKGLKQNFQVQTTLKCHKIGTTAKLYSNSMNYDAKTFHVNHGSK